MTNDIGDAALQLIDMGRVQAIGCMVGAPAWKRWSAQALRQDAVAVDVGLHLDLTEYTLLPATRKSLPLWIVHSYTGQLDRDAVRMEIRVQLDAFESTIGRPPAYVDGHQHVHQLPVVREELIEELLTRYGHLGLPWLRSTDCVQGLHPASNGGWLGWVKAQGIAMLGSRSLRALARGNGFTQNRMLLGVYGFDKDTKAYFALLSAGLRIGVDVSLLMCHPSRGVDASDAIGAARRVEFEVLCGRELGQALVEQGVYLKPMSQLL